jgi:hypothetical protein
MSTGELAEPKTQDACGPCTLGQRSWVGMLCGSSAAFFVAFGHCRRDRLRRNLCRLMLFGKVRLS